VHEIDSSLCRHPLRPCQPHYSKKIPNPVNPEINILAEQALSNQASPKLSKSTEKSGAPMATINTSSSHRPWKGLIRSLCVLALAFGIYRYWVGHESNLPPLDRDCSQTPWTDRDTDFCARMYEGVFLPAGSSQFTIKAELENDAIEDDVQEPRMPH